MIPIIDFIPRPGRAYLVLLLIPFFVTIGTANAEAQPSKYRLRHTQTAKNVLFAELFPGGILLNYERRFGKLPTGLGIRAGWGSLFHKVSLEVADEDSEGEATRSKPPEVIITKSQYHLFPLELNYLFGKKSHRFESGVGFIVAPPRSPDAQHVVRGYFMCTLGYRFQRRIHGPVFRAGISPVIGSPNGMMILRNVEAWFVKPGLSVGYAF
ncbi:MAG: hypothetical protein AAF570_20870 [Bacteroidota bacterium]